jgi:hypothetical protein
MSEQPKENGSGPREYQRASASVMRTKSIAGLAGFALVAGVSLMQGIPIADSLLRAIAGGVIAYFVTWTMAIFVWRYVIHAEMRQVLVRAEVRRREVKE